MSDHATETDEVARASADYEAALAAELAARSVTDAARARLHAVLDGDLIGAREAAAILGMTRQGLTSPATDAILRPLRRGTARRSIRLYLRSAVERFAGQRAARQLDPRLDDEGQ